jgi:hypothetical protein
MYNIYPSPVHENAYVKINKLIYYKMLSIYQSFFSLRERSIAKPHKRSPVIVDLTQVLSLFKAENERLQHTDMTGRTINNLKIV